MRESTFLDAQAGTSGEPMTLTGTLTKTGVLLGLLMITATLGFIYSTSIGMIVSVVGSLILGLIIGFKPTTAPVLAPAYALVNGYFVGAFSMFVSVALAKTQYAAAVPIAVAGTLITLGIMLTLYATRIIRVTETMRSVIIGLTLAVGLLYLFSFVVGMFAPAFIGNFAIYKSGPIGIIFSAFVIGLAAFNFLLDFDMVERGVQGRAPKYMEWYGAFGITVTLVWLYLEILRLLLKLGSNR